MRKSICMFLTGMILIFPGSLYAGEGPDLSGSYTTAGEGEKDLEAERMEAFRIAQDFIKENPGKLERLGVTGLRPDAILEKDNEWHVVYYCEGGLRKESLPRRIAVIVDKDTGIARFFTQSGDGNKDKDLRK